MDKTMLKKTIRQAGIVEKQDAIKGICRDRRVLDVGCIGQDVKFLSDHWLHQEIKSVAKEVTGVDLSRESIEILNKKGYHILHISELESVNETFDIIVMADVIEHVSNSVEFLEFYSRFLNHDGMLVITTPNANRAINFLSILIFNNYSVNEEHTCWYCPVTLQEVVIRAHLKVTGFYWLKKYYNSRNLSFITRVITWKSEFLASFRKNFSQNFMMIVSK
jgi:2-polyprenyl-3-methyl-5-hydroxy-6-metoxy-1,4-benzoquinol methylase